MLSIKMVYALEVSGSKTPQ